MIQRDATWGDLRSIHNAVKASGGFSADDLLSDPEIMDKSIGKDDNEFFFDLSDEDKAFYKSLREEFDIDKRNGTYSVTISDDGTVLELIKTLDDGSIYARREGVWFPIDPDDEDSNIFDQTLVDVSDNLVEYWDRLKEAEATITKEAIQDYLV
jgi:hypothetical protein